MTNSILKTGGKALALCAALTCTQTFAAPIITFFGDDIASGQWATDGSGLTSSFVDQSNQIDPSNGYFIETFDAATAMTGLDAFQDPQHQFDQSEFLIDGASDGCAINTLSLPGIQVVETQGAFGVAKGSMNGKYAQPGRNGGPYEDNTCFGFTPKEGNTGIIAVDYTGFLSALGGGVQLDYFGFYWGSVDSYNDFTFINSLDDSFITITGQELLDQLGGVSGNQSAPSSNTYVNIDFNGFAWDQFVVTSNGIAGEFDNVVTGLTTRRRDVPEPTTIALFGLGLMGLSLASRKAKS